MDRASHQLLARAALAEDQHGRISRRHSLDKLAQVDHLGRVTHDLVQLINRAAPPGPRPQGFVFLLEVVIFATPVHRVEQFLWRERLGKIIHRAVLNGLHGKFWRSKGGDQDNPHLGKIRLGLLEQFITAHAAQSAVGDHHEIFTTRLGEHFQGLFTGFGDIHRVAIIHQQLAYGRPHVGLIVDHQDGRQGGFHD